MDYRISPTDKETGSRKGNDEGLLLFKAGKETSHENVLPWKAQRGAETEKNSPPYASMKRSPERQGLPPKYGRHQDTSEKIHVIMYNSGSLKCVKGA